MSANQAHHPSSEHTSQQAIQRLLYCIEGPFSYNASCRGHLKTRPITMPGTCQDAAVSPNTCHTRRYFLLLLSLPLSFLFLPCQPGPANVMSVPLSSGTKERYPGCTHRPRDICASPIGQASRRAFVRQGENAPPKRRRIQQHLPFNHPLCQCCTCSSNP